MKFGPVLRGVSGLRGWKAPFAVVIGLAVFGACRRRPALSPIDPANPKRGTLSPVPTATPNFSITVTATSTSTVTLSFSSTQTITPTGTVTPTFTWTHSPSFTFTPSPTPTATPTFTSTPSPVMIDNWEDGNLNTLQAYPWWGWNDGGACTSARSNVVGGAGGTTRHMLVSGNMGATLGCGAGCYYGYWGFGTDASGPPVPNFSRLRFWARKSFPALAYSGITFWFTLNNGDAFSQDISSSVPGAWAYLDLDLNSFTADVANVYGSFASASGTISQMGLSVDAFDFVSTPGSPYTLEIDELQFAWP